MRAVTIKEAKAHLNELIDAATAGEQVVLMRGSTHVAVIVPITADDLELVTTLTDAQADRLWQGLADERASGKTVTFPSPEASVGHLGAPASATANEPAPPYRSSPVRPRKKGPSSKKADR